jgi:hypothetical protein
MRRSLLLAVSTLLAAVASNCLGAELSSDIERVVQSKRTITAPTPQLVGYKAIDEYDLASITVGLSPAIPIGYKLVLLATVPVAIDPSEEAKLRGSIPRLIRDIAASLQKKIDALPEISVSELDPDLEKRLSGYSEQIKSGINEAFISASTDFGTQIARWSPKYANDIALAVARRPCAGTVCSSTQPTPNAARYRFARLYDWANSMGLTAVNQAYVLRRQGAVVPVVPVVAILDKGHEWHDDFPKPVLQAAFVNVVKESRRTKEQLSYATAELATLSKETVAHLADVFDFPYAAVPRLTSDPAATLQGLSDELGRARLRDCVRLRGTFEPEQAGECAGYNLGQKDLANCLAGANCMPSFGARLNLATLLVRPNTNLIDIARSTALPRIQLGPAGTIVDIANKCPSSDNPNYCLLEETIGQKKEVVPTLNCIHGAGNSATALAKCAAVGLSDDQRHQLDCFLANSKNTKALALCATRETLPQDTQKIIACAGNLKGTASSVADAARCLRVGNATREARCLVNNKDNWVDAALCISGDKTPQQVKSAVHCAQSSGSLTDFGVCMVANEGNGEAQRIAACYAEGQGVPAAVAVCLASKNLTQDQRIVLECAAETNGAPQATAICAGGKLVAKEMVNCKGKKFGEGNCFNKNNELRKLAKTAGIEIGPKSVPAQLINIQLQFTQLTSGPLLDAATPIVSELMKRVAPDPRNPIGFVNPVIGATVDEFCKHNPCDIRHLPMPEIRINVPHFRL